MPRISKKRKQEWALFLKDQNRITYNELCRKCRGVDFIFEMLCNGFALPRSDITYCISETVS